VRSIPDSSIIPISVKGDRRSASAPQFPHLVSEPQKFDTLWPDQFGDPDDENAGLGARLQGGVQSDALPVQADLVRLPG